MKGYKAFSFENQEVMVTSGEGCEVTCKKGEEQCSHINNINNIIINMQGDDY